MGEHDKSYDSVAEAIAGIFGEGTSQVKKAPVSGGDINSAYLLFLSNGERVFLKANSGKNFDFFRAEAEGLSAIRKAGTIRTPEVLAIGSDTVKDISFLLMEYIEPGRTTDAALRELGEGLAGLHLAAAGEFVKNGMFGFFRDNYIGESTQFNDPKDRWITFFAECRLRPQFERAASYFSRAERKKIDRFIGRLDQYLTEPEKPALLHGDLWSGNYMIDVNGRSWLIDPAVYVGHPEADLAMTELFGGFGNEFYNAYRETAGIDGGYRDRKDIYNLYHLLNHLNIFGSGYLSAVQAVLRRLS